MLKVGDENPRRFLLKRREGIGKVGDNFKERIDDHEDSLVIEHLEGQIHTRSLLHGITCGGSS